MHKSAAIAFQKRLAEFNGQAAELHRIAVDVLEADHGIPRSHFGQGADIAAELCLAAPNLVQQTYLLTEMGEDVEAVAVVRAALRALKTADPHIFDQAPSAKLLAAMTCGLTPSADSWASSISQAEYAHGDERRRQALRLKREATAAGRLILTEAQVSHLPGRDEAILAQARSGGGVLSSADNRPMPTRTNRHDG